mgnify:CR=1 FL=1
MRSSPSAVRFQDDLGGNDVGRGAAEFLVVLDTDDSHEAVKAAFFGPITPHMPASILQFHKDFTLVADEDALSLL